MTPWNTPEGNALERSRMTAGPLAAGRRGGSAGAWPRSRGGFLATIWKLIWLGCMAAWGLPTTGFGSNGSSPAVVLTDWFVGTWVGIMDGHEETYTLKIHEAGDQKEWCSGATRKASGKYGITGKKLFPVAIGVTAFGVGCSIVSFSTPAQATVVLVAVSENRMDGSIRPHGRDLQPIRFWRAGASAHQVQPRLRGFLGRWRGEGPGGTEFRMTVPYIDLSGASIREESWSAKSHRRGAKSIWRNARMTPEGTLVILTPSGKERLLCSLTPDHGQMTVLRLGSGQTASSTITLIRQEPAP